MFFEFRAPFITLGKCSIDPSSLPLSAPTLSPRTYTLPLLYQGDLTHDTADSPYPSTPELSPFNSDPSVAECSQDDADLFETVKVEGKAERSLTDVISTVPLKVSSKGIGPQEPLSLDINVDVPALGRSSNRLEKPLTGGASLLFHRRSPRNYVFGQDRVSKSDYVVPNPVFVLRSSHQIIGEDSSDEESEAGDRDGGEKYAYSFPCEGSRLNELVSLMASLNLGKVPIVARPTITPSRVRPCISPFVHARTPVSSPVAMLRPSAAQNASFIEVDKDLRVCPKIVDNDVLHPQGPISEAVQMDGIVFHPEVKDMEMTEALSTNRKLYQAALVYLLRLTL